MLGNSRSSESTATLWMISSALSFSLMGVCVKTLGGRIPVTEVVLARSMVSMKQCLVIMRQPVNKRL